MATTHQSNPWQGRLRPNEVAENEVIEIAARSIVDAGNQVGVHNGEDWSVGPTDDVQLVLESLRQTDSDVLHVFRDGRDTGSYLFLVYGNEPYEVLADWTLDVDALLQPAVEAAESLEARS